jgi:CBS domain-containing protein
MQLKDVMTRNVEDIRPQSTLQDAAAKMRQLDVGSLPVCQDDKLVGIITDRDIAIRCVAEGRSPKNTRVADVMSLRPAFCYEDEDISVAADLMEQRQIRRLPVFDSQQRLCGIIALADIALRTGDEGLTNEVLQEVSAPPQMHA